MGSNPPPPFDARDYRGLEPQAGSTPEILPPEGPAASPQDARYGMPPLPPPRPRPRSRWALAPATHTLVAINCAVYLLMVFTDRKSVV